VSIVASGIWLISREWNTISIRNAVSSRGRRSSVSDCEVWLLRGAGVSNVSSVQIHLNEVVVEAHASVVVLDEIQRSSNAQYSVHFRSDIDVHHVGLQITSCGGLSSVQNGKSWGLVVVRISTDGSNVQTASNEMSGSLSVNHSLREDCGCHGGSSWNAREVESEHQSVEIVTISRRTAARSSLSVLSSANLLTGPYLDAVCSDVANSKDEEDQ